METDSKHNQHIRMPD